MSLGGCQMDGKVSTNALCYRKWDTRGLEFGGMVGKGEIKSWSWRGKVGIVERMLGKS